MQNGFVSNILRHWCETSTLTIDDHNFYRNRFNWLIFQQENAKHFNNRHGWKDWDAVPGKKSKAFFGNRNLYYKCPIKDFSIRYSFCKDKYHVVTKLN